MMTAEPRPGDLIAFEREQGSWNNRRRRTQHARVVSVTEKTIIAEGTNPNAIFKPTFRVRRDERYVIVGRED